MLKIILCLDTKGVSQIHILLMARTRSIKENVCENGTWNEKISMKPDTVSAVSESFSRHSLTDDIYSR